MACCDHIHQDVPAKVVLLTIDEGQFHLSGSVNKQNFCNWPENNPRQLYERPLHIKRVIVYEGLAFCGPFSCQNSETLGVHVSGFNRHESLHKHSNKMKGRFERIVSSAFDFFTLFLFYKHQPLKN